MGRVDVWMPVRDAAETLGTALSSLDRQTFRDWRLVAVDDGSRDRSAAILEEYFSGGRPGVMLRTPGTGIVAALQACAAASSAPLVARLDADDLAHRERLQEQVEAAAEADIVGSRVRILRPLGAGMSAFADWVNSLRTHADILNNLFVESPLVHPAVLFRREAYDRAGGYRDQGWAEDYDLWLRFWRTGARFASVPRRLLAWRDRPGRLTRTDPRYSAAAFRRAKLAFLLEHPVLRPKSVTVWGAGASGRRWIRELRALGVTVRRAIDIDPRKIGRTVQGTVRVEGPEAVRPAGEERILVTVESRGARALIRERLRGRGFVEGRDWLALA